jgi:glutamyl-tRNA reductase
MAGGASAPAPYIVVGASHKTSTVALRDRLFVDDAAAPALLRGLCASGLEQGILLSTCDRVELQGVAADPVAARAAVAAALGGHAGLDPATLAAELYVTAGEPALRQIFAVAASLESAVIGEPQILGQVKAAHRLAREAGSVGRELEAALQAAYGAAKRVRSETAIAEGPVSIAATAIQLARDVHGALAPLDALLIGNGEMGLLMAEELRRAGLQSIMVTAQNPARAEALARQLGGHYTDFDTLAAALSHADIVVSCAGTGRYLLTGEMVEQALRRRRRRPVYLIDAAIPSDIEPAVNRIDDAYLYDLADLERAALAGQAGRARAAEAAWGILDEELSRFRRERAERQAVPALVLLRRRFEAMRDAVLAENESQDAAEATRRLVNRLLHDPSEALRAIAAEDGQGRQALAEDILSRLFRLAAQPDGDGPVKDGRADDNEESKR